MTASAEAGALRQRLMASAEYVPAPKVFDHVNMPAALHELLEAAAINQHEVCLSLHLHPSHSSPHMHSLSPSPPQVWAAAKVAQGWRWGVHQDSVAKTHPLIRPFGTHPDSAQHESRRSVVLVVKHILDRGFELRSKSTPAALNSSASFRASSTSSSSLLSLTSKRSSEDIKAGKTADGASGSASGTTTSGRRRLHRVAAERRAAAAGGGSSGSPGSTPGSAGGSGSGRRGHVSSGNRIVDVMVWVREAEAAAAAFRSAKKQLALEGIKESSTKAATRLGEVYQPNPFTVDHEELSHAMLDLVEEIASNMHEVGLCVNAFTSYPHLPHAHLTPSIAAAVGCGQEGCWLGVGPQLGRRHQAPPSTATLRHPDCRGARRRPQDCHPDSQDDHIVWL